MEQSYASLLGIWLMSCVGHPVDVGLMVLLSIYVSMVPVAIATAPLPGDKNCHSIRTGIAWLPSLPIPDLGATWVLGFTSTYQVQCHLWGHQL